MEPISFEMIDRAEANIRADYRGGKISKEQFRLEMMIVARVKVQARASSPEPQPQREAP